MSSVKPPPSRRKVSPPSAPPPSQRKKVVAPPSSARSKTKVSSSRRKRVDSESSSSSSSSSKENEDWVADKKGNGYSENKRRRQLKNRKRHSDDEVPTKENNYLNWRMSELLRGGKDIIPEPGDFFYEEEFSDYEPDGYVDKIKRELFVKSKEKKFGPRCGLACFAVALLWMSSAAACRAIITLVIASPDFIEIEESISAAQDIVIQQRDQYLKCVNDTVDECGLVIDAELSDEEERLSSIQVDTAAILTEEEATLIRCRADMEIGVTALENDPDFNVNEFLLDNVGSECDDLELFFGPQVNTLEAINTAQDTGKDANEVIGDFEAQLAAREAYDREYQQNITNKFGPATQNLNNGLYQPEDFTSDIDRQLNELRACFADNGRLEVDGEEFFCEDENNPRARGQQVVDSLEFQFSEMNRSVQDYIEDVNNLINEVDRIAGFADIINLDLGLIPDINLGDLEANMQIGLGQFGISNEAFDDFVAQQEAQLLDEIAKAEAELAALEQETADRQQEFLDNANQDFDAEFPGTDPATLDSADQAKLAADLLSGQIAQDLNSVNGEAPEVEQPVTDFQGIIDTTDIQFLQGIEDRNIEFFSYGDNVFFNLNGRINDIVNAILLFDVFWRVMQSILIFKKYWNISAIATPPGDARADKGMMFKEKKSTLQLIGAILTNPIVQVVFNLLIMFTVSILFYTAYEPLLSEFEKGCIKANAIDIDNGLADGTMIFNNLNSMSRNFAATPGDREVTENLDKFNLDRQVICGRLLQDSVNVRQSNIDAHTELAQSFTRLQETFNLFSGCVDWAGAEASIRTASGDDLSELEGRTLDEIFTDAACNAAIRDIVVDQTALHDCTNVSVCENICGPNFDLIATTTHAAACTTEFGFHSYFLIGLLTTAMFICLNLSRFYLLNGILEVFWSVLCVGLFSYTVSCSGKGTIVPPEEVEEGEPFKDVIERALTKALRDFTIKGYLDLFFAAMINLPWIVFLISFSRIGSFEQSS